MYSISATRAVEAESSRRRSTREAILSPGSVDTGCVRPRPSGKFRFVRREKFWVRGVTYGTASPGYQGAEYPPSDVAENDFAQIAATGLNTVRTLPRPPRCLLDAAQRHDLRVMVGLPWERDASLVPGVKANHNEDLTAQCERSIR